MKEVIPNAKAIDYPKCGHILFMEEPEIFNKDLMDFIG